MKKHKIVKHTKIKNSGILFELLTRQLTTDIMNGVENSLALSIIEEHFKSDSELGKEYVLYQALLKYKTIDKEQGKDFINEVIKARDIKINKNKLSKEKYNLIKTIKETFDMSDFFNAKIEDYKLYASIYQLFEHDSSKYIESPEQIVNSRYSLLENMNKTYIRPTLPTDDEKSEELMMTEYSKENADLRLLTYKVMIDKFNDKYATLDDKQSNLIKEYINNISSANSLKNYLHTEIPIINEEMTKLTDVITSKAIKIKVNEVRKQLSLITEQSVIDDNHLYAVMNSYELLKELIKYKETENV